MLSLHLILSHLHIEFTGYFINPVWRYLDSHRALQETSHHEVHWWHTFFYKTLQIVIKLLPWSSGTGFYRKFNNYPLLIFLFFIFSGSWRAKWAYTGAWSPGRMSEKWSRTCKEKKWWGNRAAERCNWQASAGTGKHWTKNTCRQCCFSWGCWQSETYTWNSYSRKRSFGEASRKYYCRGISNKEWAWEN